MKYIGQILTGIGLIILVYVCLFHPSSLIQRAHIVLDACQESLPRDQRCVLTAVPEGAHDD